MLFSGGMPRASYGDRHCVTVLQDKTQVTLDFTSRVIDFFTVHCVDGDAGEKVTNKTVIFVRIDDIVFHLQAFVYWVWKVVNALLEV